MKVVLFDMDGTLTPAREKMTWKIADNLLSLQNKGYEIGIVSGSDLDYIKQQCDVLFDLSLVECDRIHWLPCNGTKYYRWGANKFTPIYENSMRTHLKEKEWRRLMQLLTSIQSSITRVHRNIPMTGNFINYRGSMINWCPIGRSATKKDRKEWIQLDEEQSIRKKWLDITRSGLDNAGLQHVVIKLGGDTSFDIYPKGWDKTFAFGNFSDYQTIYFVGDRCTPTGNDYEAYVKAGKYGFKTSDPDETSKIISKIIGEK